MNSNQAQALQRMKCAQENVNFKTEQHLIAA